MSNSDPLVRKLAIWRNNFYAHRSSDHALDAEAFARKYPRSSPDIEALLANGVAIVNRYSVLFMATSRSNMAGRDDCQSILLDKR